MARPAFAVFTPSAAGATPRVGDASSPGSEPIQRHLATLTAPLGVALVALVVIGGATRVMQA
ncbi:MAG: heme A synthase, partial [Cyanobium sp.]